MTSRGGFRKSGHSHAPKIEQYRLTLVVCEGVVTEVEYFNSTRARLRDYGLSVKPVGLGKDPVRVVERAVELRDARARDGVAYDDAWVAIDVDDHANLQDALILARREGVQVALSNPCFELWLALHAGSHASHLTAQAAGALAKSRNVCVDKHIVENNITGAYEAARKNAELLRRKHEREGRTVPDNNPSTDVDLLIETLLTSVPTEPSDIRAVL